MPHTGSGGANVGGHDLGQLPTVAGEADGDDDADDAIVFTPEIRRCFDDFPSLTMLFNWTIATPCECFSSGKRKKRNR